MHERLAHEFSNILDNKTANKQSKILYIMHISNKSILIQYSYLAAVGNALKTFSFNEVDYFAEQYFCALHSIAVVGILGCSSVPGH